MSATPSKNAKYPYSWFQPVRYDLDAYRQYAAGLDISLAQLEATHRAGRRHAIRCSTITLQRNDTLDIQPENPPEQSSC